MDPLLFPGICHLPVNIGRFLFALPQQMSTPLLPVLGILILRSFYWLKEKIIDHAAYHFRNKEIFYRVSGKGTPSHAVFMVFGEDSEIGKTS